MKVTHLNFKVKTCFSAPLLKTHTPNNLNSITYQENNVQSPIRTYPIIALHEHQAIFHVLELYFTNQIPLCHIALRSITCHVLVNNLHFITYSNCIEKNSHGSKCYWNRVFQAILPHLTFSTN